ncbi:MAG: hypothetical protein JWO30_238 [Fibrobacteres bacterium]|nr:hypothetical protein [Fibrobacterota bacterium]
MRLGDFLPRVFHSLQRPGAVFMFTCFFFGMILIGVEMARAFPPQRAQMGLALAGNE